MRLKDIWRNLSNRLLKIENIRELFSYDCQVMSAYHIWPMERVDLKIFFIYYVTAVIPGFIYCYKNYGSVINMTAALIEVLSFHAFLLKYFIIFVQRAEFGKLLGSLRNSWKKSLEEEISEWNNKHDKLQRNITLFEKCMIWYVKIAFVNYSIVPILLAFVRKYFFNDSEIELRTVYKSDFLYDVRSNIYIYIIYVIVKLRISFFSLMMVQAIDNIVLNVFLHIGKYFEFVELKLRTLNDDLKNLSEAELRQYERTTVRRLKNIVDEHIIAIGFVEQYERIVSPIMLFLYMNNTFLVCFLSFILTLIVNDTPFLIRMIVFIFYINYQALLPSYTGNKIIENSARVGMQAYNFKWYNKSPAVKQMLQMIIMRSNKTVGITAGKFYFVSLRSFGSMLSKAASYFALLRSVYER